MKYGVFCQTVLDFLIIALCIFWAIRILCKFRAKEKAPEPAPAPEPPPTPEDILLLREIRDALKK